MSCPPPKACQEEGVCEPDTGECVYAAKANGTLCRAATDPCEFESECDGTGPECPPNGIAVGIECDDGDPCTENDVCQANGVCLGTPASCDDGFACTDSSCDQARGCVHTVRSDACFIEGTCYEAGDVDPESPCRYCDPAQYRRRWTRRTENSPCGDGACATGTTCVNGICGNGEATGDGCAIDGVCYPAGAIRPSNTCYVCDPVRSRTMWSSQADGTPCTGLCRTGGTCRAASAAGGTVTPGFCHINDICFPAGEAHPTLGPCWVCDPARNPKGWTTLRRRHALPRPLPGQPHLPGRRLHGRRSGRLRAAPPTRWRAVCDPETGGCVVRPTPDVHRDTKGCEVCPGCYIGVCAGEHPVDWAVRCLRSRHRHVRAEAGGWRILRL